MKSSIKTMFVVLAIVMIFVAVQAVCAGPAIVCSVTVDGTVDEILEDGGVVVKESETVSTTVYGMSCSLDVAVGDEVKITAGYTTEGKLLACSINGVSLRIIGPIGANN